MFRTIAPIGLACAAALTTSTSAVTIIDMPPPPAADALTTYEQATAETPEPNVGELALARYRDARRGPRNVLYLGGYDLAYRSYYGPHHWPYGSRVFFSGFGHSFFVPTITVSSHFFH